MTVLHVFSPRRLDGKLLQKVQTAWCADAEHTRHVLCLFSSQKCDDASQETEHLTRRHGTAFREQWLRILYQYMPDLVHLHGSDDSTTAHIAHWSAQRNFRVQRTTHAVQLSLKKNITFLRLKLPHLLLYTPTIKRCIGRKQRSTHITNRILHALLLLLKKYYDGNAYEFDDKDHATFSSLSNSDWQTINELIRQQHLPSLDTLLPQQYSLLSSFSAMTANTPPEQTSSTFTEQLQQLHEDIQNECVNLRQLAEFYQTMHTLDTDETLLIKEVKKLRRTSFLKDMETIMSEMFALSEGFMLLPPRNSIHTNTIRKHIFHALVRQQANGE